MVVGKAGAGHARQREGVWLVRVLLCSDEACDAGDKATFVQRCCALGLDERGRGRDWRETTN